MAWTEAVSYTHLDVYKRQVQEVKEKFENEKVRSSMRWVFQIMVTLVFAAVVAIMMFQTVTMQESSMEPTISVGDRFFINRAVYKFSSPQRGDMIAVSYTHLFH